MFENLTNKLLKFTSFKSGYKNAKLDNTGFKKSKWMCEIEFISNADNKSTVNSID